MSTDQPPRELPARDEPPEFEPLHAPGLADLDSNGLVVAPTASRSPRPSRRRRVAIGVSLLVAALGLLTFLVEFRTRREPPAPFPGVLPPRPMRRAAAPVAEAPRVAPAPAPVSQAPPREVPRFARGVPAVVSLSSLDHGLDLRRAGFALTRRDPRAWTIATAPSPNKVFPPYAALFVADVGPVGALLDVGLVSRRPRLLRGLEARVFIAQPSHRPDRGSFDLVVKQGGDTVERHEQVYVDAVTPIDEKRFVVEDLSPQQHYTVRLRANPDGPTPPVLMVATRPSSAQHLQAPRYDEPLDQQLLVPGQATSVTAATALAFVVPMMPGAPERSATVEVFRPGAPPTEKELESPANWYEVGQGHLARLDEAGAREAFMRCLALAPTHEGCALGLSRAAMLEK